MKIIKYLIAIILYYILQIYIIWVLDIRIDGWNEMNSIAIKGIPTPERTEEKGGKEKE